MNEQKFDRHLIQHRYGKKLFTYCGETFSANISGSLRHRSITHTLATTTCCACVDKYKLEPTMICLGAKHESYFENEDDYVLPHAENKTTPNINLMELPYRYETQYPVSVEVEDDFHSRLARARRLTELTLELFQN